MALTFIDWLMPCPLVAILRGVRPDEVAAIADVLDSRGIGIIEVPLNSPAPLDSIRLLAERYAGRLLIGAGTVMTPAQVAAIHAAGGRLIVTPHAATDVIRAAKALGMFACPGFATPTEAFAALDAGADALKLFPAEAASLSVLRALRAVLPPSTPVLPVGGIDASNMAAWLQAGAAGFGLGSAIYRAGDSAARVRDKSTVLVDKLKDIGIKRPAL